MTWQNEIVRIVRFIIDDLDSDTYADSRIEEVIIVAAQMINIDIEWAYTYSIDVDTLTLSPDPTEQSTKDNHFINLLSLKSACILIGSEYKTLCSQSVRVMDGPSQVDARQVAKDFYLFYKKICDDFEQALLQYRLGNSNAGAAILTPYTQESISSNIYNTFN